MLDYYDHEYVEFWGTIIALRPVVSPGNWTPLPREVLGALLERYYTSGMRNDLFGLLEGLFVDVGLRGHVNQEHIGYRVQVISILHRIVEGEQLPVVEDPIIAQDHTPPPQGQPET
ncbi:hypothetical protein LTR10_024272 [Elasticomyces elasticus]|uniref:Uncharacterized protein n=1 Tax=Exophiala sideris TaxID=1016849 RepID=A0ABR0IWA1_9EURO|nr:hypothetical protein LTR10_024272 [Elasticomyces elasticus]KAK5021563.1 hypothetical protein LTS07_010860 [Exophiala sideris]KAK5024805.1 hypothetical protein LTR13_010774 [Exophiala sideris]KAK5049700.1 hypothetical protein LTR69_010884 [Exophiala sideris]KAK5176681.1 hypothetical protein LTR44_010751 [Eurotiomycetes sp. CCFEE 6388]